MTQEQIITIIAEELPGFWSQVVPCRFLSMDFLSIRIAASPVLINNVDGQQPQRVALNYVPATGELVGHLNCTIYREPQRFNPAEQYLAMKGERVPFRKPKKGHEADALRRFLRRYRETLTQFRPVLCYQDLVDYDKLLSI